LFILKSFFKEIFLRLTSYPCAFLNRNEADVVAQVTECLLSKCEALSSDPRAAPPPPKKTKKPNLNRNE
jgi:hypothetical protein